MKRKAPRPSHGKSVLMTLRRGNQIHLGKAPENCLCTLIKAVAVYVSAVYKFFSLIPKSKLAKSQETKILLLFLRKKPTLVPKKQAKIKIQSCIKLLIT